MHSCWLLHFSLIHCHVALVHLGAVLLLPCLSVQFTLTLDKLFVGAPLFFAGVLDAQFLGALFPGATRAL